MSKNKIDHSKIGVDLCKVSTYVSLDYSKHAYCQSWVTQLMHWMGLVVKASMLGILFPVRNRDELFRCCY